MLVERILGKAVDGSVPQDRSSQGECETLAAGLLGEVIVIGER